MLSKKFITLARLSFLVILCDASGLQDNSSALMCRPFNKSSGMEELCGYKDTADYVSGFDEFQTATWLRLHNDYDFRLENCTNISRILTCTEFFPRCVSNVRGPHLLCKSVCDAFFSRCGEEFHTEFGDEWYWKMRWLCSLFPEKDNPRSTDYRKRCFEPPGFKACDPKCDLEPIKCFPVVVPECQKLGYNFTIFPEEYQEDNFFDVQKEFQKKDNTLCGALERKLLCTKKIPPCFKEDMTRGCTCREDCLNFLEKNCSSPRLHLNKEKCQNYPKRSPGNENICKKTGFIDDDLLGISSENRQSRESQQTGNFNVIVICLLTNITVIASLLNSYK